jgi:hypothetical protein
MTWIFGYPLRPIRGNSWLDCVTDQQTMKVFRDGCRTLDLVPHDPIIIGDRGFYSAAEAGLLPGWSSGERIAADRQA